jgi:hypothetical protein
MRKLMLKLQVNKKADFVEYGEGIVLHTFKDGLKFLHAISTAPEDKVYLANVNNLSKVNLNLITKLWDAKNFELVEKLISK